MNSKYLSLLAVVLAVAPIVSAQADRATLTGTLRDPSGAVVADAKLTVTYPTSGLLREAQSNGSGSYFVNGLTLGAIVVNVEKAGFRPLRTETTLSIGETRTMDFVFEVATVGESIQVVAETELTRNTAALGGVMNNTQISQLPINGRNWSNLTSLIPGAIDTGGSTIRFLGHGGDDSNLRIDGVDATSVRNQTQRSRLLVSTDAISEFKVSSGLYSAESGGSNGGQVEIVSKAGSNQFHGTAFEYLRNNVLDARSPFDKALPPFRLNQFGGTLGGRIYRDKTFFFASYEGLIQRQGLTQIGFVPSAAFRAGSVAAVKPILDLYPIGQTPTANASVDQWNGVGSNKQDEHSGLFRLDHRFNDKLSSYYRFNTNNTVISNPSTLLPINSSSTDVPTNGVIDFLYLMSPQTTNEFRIAANYAQPLNSRTASPIDIAIAVPSLSTLPAGTRRMAFGTTQSIVDQWSTFRGNHAIKAGVEIRRLLLVIHDFANAQAGTLTYASLADFQVNKLTTAEYSAELPTKQMRKISYFGYIQDEWKVTRNITANIGLRYEFYNRFAEIHGRAIPFDIQGCGGFCPKGSEFSAPDMNNFAPRVSLAWSIKEKTVVRAGGGIYYGDAQLGDAYSPANNDAQRFTLSILTTPGLSFPITPYLNPNAALATAPRSMPINKRNQVSQQWGLTVEHSITPGVNFSVGYQGQQSYHVFSRDTQNVLNPITKQRPLPAFDPIDVRGAVGVASFHGLVGSLQVKNWHGLLFQTNYMFSHALNDNSSGGGGADGSPQNVACRSCDKASSSIDARHVLSLNYAYRVPVGKGRWYGGFEWSGITTARTGLPINVTVTRAAATLADGNTLSAQRPNLIQGVPLYLDYATTGKWLNPAAFALPAAGTWGDLGRNALRAPGLFQVDTALVKKTRLTETTSLEIGAQVFNVFNHPQLAAPTAGLTFNAANPLLNTNANFGRITAPVNRTPVGSGTPRQVQLTMRLSF